LSDEKRRKLYDSGVDTEGQAPPNWGQGGNFQDFEQFSQAFSGFGFDPFESIFGSMGGFGSQGKRRPREPQAQYGHDITIGLEISFMDAIKGTDKKVSYEKIEMCNSCKGAGGAKGGGMIACPNCKGTGNQTMRKDNFVFSFTCSNCRGSGHILKDPCKYYSFIIL
jgi:molecular chaperone DnaJ